ncbi:HAMP domain-containing histidine kinase [Patescibacteria group bacterium]|nr:HAMP domain-containing histidine kinase [Patescibacteria group bacterium]MBU1895284.1 HAMP domain-containing histidine kinase [Patescibacteria group bacterium]
MSKENAGIVVCEQEVLEKHKQECFEIKAELGRIDSQIKEMDEIVSMSLQSDDEQKVLVDPKNKTRLIELLELLSNKEAVPHSRLQVPIGYQSHDIGGDLHVINNYSELILLGLEDSEENKISRKFWDSIVLVWPRYKLICEDLVSRSVSPEKVDDKFRDTVEVEELFQVVDRYLDKPEKSQGIRFFYEIEENAKLAVLVEPICTGVLYNKLRNITNNPLQKGGIQAKTVAFYAFVEGESLVIQILDDGKGVPPEARDDIYEEGFTTRSEGKEHGGLGLAHADKQIESMGGSLTFETRYGEENQGHLPVDSSKSFDKNKYNTIFEIKFPLKKET